MILDANKFLLTNAVGLKVFDSFIGPSGEHRRHSAEMTKRTHATKYNGLELVKNVCEYTQFL